VCGLSSKLVLPDFQEKVSNFDIFNCTETHQDKVDAVYLNNYVFVPKHRRQQVVEKSGGIGTFVKSSLYKHCFFFIDTECEYVQWFKISKSVLHCNEDYVVGTVYIPPENTK